MLNNNSAQNAMYSSVTTDSSMNGLTITNGANNLVTTDTVLYHNGISGWDYWQGYYYPQVIHHSYPIYLQERAKDKGKTAFEVLKALQDKNLVKFEKVSDFIDAMDTLIKIL